MIKIQVPQTSIVNCLFIFALDGKKPLEDNKPIQGLDFKKLTENYPNIQAQLLSFRNRLLDLEFDIEMLKVWEVAGLSFL